MSLHRQVRALLRESGHDLENAPDVDAWKAFLLRLGDVFASLDSERFRLERSLQFHHSEVQSLYQELLTQREQLQVVAALVEEPLVLLDSHGVALLISPRATGLLGYTEQDAEAESLLWHIGVAPLLGSSDVGDLLREASPVQARGTLHRRDGSSLEAELEIQPLLRETHLVGALLTVRDRSGGALSPFQSVRRLSSRLLSLPLLPEVEKCARLILSQTERAMSILQVDETEKTVEELPPVRKQRELRE